MKDLYQTKYDRQLRLWGPHGQKKLTWCRALILGSSALATETLKNLILPGLGYIAVMDDAIVTYKDLGNNFFLQEIDIGLPRATCIVQHLLQLNTDIQATAHVKDARHFMTHPDQMFLQDFHIVIAALRITMEDAAILCNACSLFNIQFIHVQTNTLLGSIRVYVPEHTIVESKPDGNSQDFRIADPFPSLLTHCCETQLSTLSDRDHGLVPYIVLLVQAVNEFTETHEGASPGEGDIQWIQQWVDSHQRQNVEEDNFKEAYRKASVACRKFKLPTHIQTILVNAGHKTIDDLVHLLFLRSSKNVIANDRCLFWTAAKAMNIFVNTYGKCPVSVEIPDLTSTTDYFISLQSIYRKEAEKDFLQYNTIIDKLIEEMITHELVLECIQMNKIFSSIDHKDIKEEWKQHIGLTNEYLRRFTQEFLNCHTIYYRSLIEELHSPLLSESLEMIFDTDDSEATSKIIPKDSPFNLYILQRAIELSGWSPTNQLEINVNILKSLSVPKVMSQLGLHPKNQTLHDLYYQLLPLMTKDYELHPTAAFMGGIAAQEAIKLVTGQFMPLNNTFIWNGFTSTGLSLQL